MQYIFKFLLLSFNYIIDFSDEIINGLQLPVYNIISYRPYLAVGQISDTRISKIVNFNYTIDTLQTKNNIILFWNH